MDTKQNVIVNNMWYFLALIEAIDSNPNGDPNADNRPRIDPETGQGLISDVCMKRKIRDYVEVKMAGVEGYQNFITTKSVLDNLVEDAWKEIPKVEEAKMTDTEKKRMAREILCKKYFDISAFGAVLACKGKNDSVTGPVQMTFARSVDRIYDAAHTITRRAVTKEDKAEVGQTMDEKHTVPYALYVTQGFIIPSKATLTGFTEEKLEVFWDALANMFELDRSAARGAMAVRAIYAFKHQSPLGNCQAYKLRDRITITKKEGVKVPRNFSDYNIKIDLDNLPKGVEFIQIA